jgi:hypothetical protein
MLEQIAYQIPRELGEDRIYTVRDLEYLSAVELYGSGPLKIGGFKPLGRIGGGLGSGPLKPSLPSKPLTIRPFSSFDLHIHEGAGGTGHIKYPDGSRTLLNSYDAAMADLWADRLEIKKILKKLKYDLDND